MPDPPQTLREALEQRIASIPHPRDDYARGKVVAYLTALHMLNDAHEAAVTRAQAEQRLTDQALRDACSTPPDTSDDEITDMRRRLLDALFGG